MKINYITIIALCFISILNIGCTPESRLNQYEDGLFSFKLPADWQLESKENSGLIFVNEKYNAKLQTSSRVHSSLATENQARSFEAIRWEKDQNISIQALGEKKAISSYRETGNKGEKHIFNQCWEIANPFSTNLVFVAKFSLTIPASKMDSIDFKEDAAVLEECFRDVVFSKIEINKNAQQ